MAPDVLLDAGSQSFRIDVVNDHENSVAAGRQESRFRHRCVTDTCLFPGYDRLGEEAGRTVLRDR